MELTALSKEIISFTLPYDESIKELEEVEIIIKGLKSNKEVKIEHVIVTNVEINFENGNISISLGELTKWNGK